MPDAGADRSGPRWMIFMRPRVSSIVKQRILLIGFLLVLIVVSGIGVFKIRSGSVQSDLCLRSTTYPSGIAITSDGDKIYITDSDANRILVVSVPEKKITRVIPVSGRTESVVFTPDGS